MQDLTVATYCQQDKIRMGNGRNKAEGAFRCLLEVIRYAPSFLMRFLVRGVLSKRK